MKDVTIGINNRKKSFFLKKYIENLDKYINARKIVFKTIL